MLLKALIMYPLLVVLNIKTKYILLCHLKQN